MPRRILTAAASLLTLLFLLAGTVLPACAAQPAANAKALLNTVSLQPTKTGFGPTDDLVSKVLASVLKPDMDNYQKVKACYDYLLKDYKYGTSPASSDYALYVFDFPGPVYAYDVLQGKQGVCDDYASAFAALTRAIGFNTYVVGGQARRSDGTYSNHAWAVIKIGGTEYLFDPQIEGANAQRNGSVSYNWFCKTYAEKTGYRGGKTTDYFKPLDQMTAADRARTVSTAEANRRKGQNTYRVVNPDGSVSTYTVHVQTA